MNVNAHGEPPSTMPRSTWSTVLLIAVSFGLVTGLVEGVGLVLSERFRILSRNAALSGVPVEMIWASPILDSLLFLILGIVLCLAIRIGGWRSLRIPVFMFATLMFADWLFLTERFHWAGVMALSIGLSSVITRIFNSYSERCVRFLRVSLPFLAAVAGLAFLLVGLLPRWVESRRIQELPNPQQGRPNILVVVVDTLRADRLSCYGYGRRTSPSIDEIARQGVLFERAFSTSSWTLPSHASMLTGRSPSDHGAETDAYDGRYPTLPESLSEHGYRTAAFSGNLFWFTRQRGFGKGFLTFQDRFNSVVDLSLQTVYGRLFKTKILPLFDYADVPGRAPAPSINRALLEWLDRTGSRPFFAFVNYFDVHGPYLPPQPFRSQFSKKKEPGGRLHGLVVGHRVQRLSPEELKDESDAYDGSIAFVDNQLAELLAELKRRGLYDNTIVVITSDHGEAFGEHGFLAHRANLYTEVIRVPLIMQWPGKVPAGARFQRPVSNAWLPATLLDLAGVKDERFPGPSLASAWGNPQQQDEWPYPIQELHQMSSFLPEDRVPTSIGSMKSIVTPSWHYLVHETLGQELYNWPLDPAEEHNLIETEQGRSISKELSETLQSLLVHKR